MENALYYTFSTIAQSLAAVFALVGTFVVFRIQQIATTLHGTAETILRPYLPNLDAKRLIAQGHYTELMHLVESIDITKQGFTISDEYKVCKEIVDNGVAARTSLVRQFQQAMTVTAITVVFAVGVLTISPRLGEHTIAGGSVLLIGVLAFAAALFLNLRVIWDSVNRTG